MRVMCVHCGEPIPAHDVNLGALLAKCCACDEIFSIADMSAVPDVSRQVIPRPPRIQVLQELAGLAITFRWFTPAAFMLLFFCMAWDSFIIFWYSMAFNSSSPTAWLMLVFPVAHVAVGIGLTWLVIGLFVNRTTIRADAEFLEVRHGPLPWPGNRRLRIGDIADVFSQQRTASSLGQPNPGTVAHDVNARLVDGGKVALIRNLSNHDEAQYISHALREHLRLPHRT